MTEMTYRELRSDLADALNRVQYRSETITITRRGKAVARIVPIEENAMTTYTAAIGLVSAVVAGDHCDVSVAENDLVGYRNDQPEYAMGNKVVLDPVELDVRTDDDVAGKVYDAADELLTANGWRRTGDWDDAAGDAAYAPVERA